MPNGLTDAFHTVKRDVAQPCLVARAAWRAGQRAHDAGGPAVIVKLKARIGRCAALDGPHIMLKPTLFALPLLVYKLTGSALNLGLTTAATYLPYALFGLVIGAWVDRTDRKRLMMVADIARAAVIALIPLLASLHLLAVGWIYAVSFVSSTLTICFDAGEFAAIPSLVTGDDLVTANGRIQASYSAATIVGPLLAGLLVAVVPLQTVLLVDVLSFLISASSLALIRTSFNRTGKWALTRLRSDVVAGLRYVWAHPVLRNISLMMALLNFIEINTMAQLVLFAKRQLTASDSQVALLYAAGSGGIVVLSLAAGPLRKRLPFSKAALGALMLEGLLTALLAAMHWYWAAVGVWALLMGVGVFFNINTTSLRQAIVPEHLLGRVRTASSVLAFSANPLGAFVGGLAVTWTGNVALVYAAVGGLTFIIALAFSFTALGQAERYLAGGDRASEVAVPAAAPR